MSIKLPKNVLNNFLKQVLFEDTWSTHGPYNDIMTSGDDSTIADEVPVQPSEMMAGQLADERPPVEDEDFVPANADELSRAARVIAQQVPLDQIEDFYRNLHRLLDSSIEQQNNPEIQLGSDEEEEVEAEINPKEKATESIRAQIKNILSEGGSDWSQFKLGKRHADTEDEYYDDHEEPPDPGRDGKTLASLQQITGRASASGVDKYIRQIMSRIGYIANSMSESDLNRLQAYATRQFINLLRAEDYIDDSDVEEMRLDRAIVRELDSFRHFFTGGVLLPAYKQMQKEAYKAVEEAIPNMDIPPEVATMVKWQSLGEAPEDFPKIGRKLAKSYDKAQVPAMMSKVRESMAKLKDIAKLPEDLGERATTRWESLSAGHQKAALKQAMESTATYQEEMGA